MPDNDYDFSGYATKYGLKCRDGRVIIKGAFAHQGNTRIPMVWHHQHNDPGNVLGYADLEARSDGIYARAVFNDTDNGRKTKALIMHGDIDSLSIFANDLVEQQLRVSDGVIRELSVVLAGSNPGARIDYVALQHGDGFNDVVYDDKATIYTGEHVIVHAADKQQADQLSVGDVLSTFNSDQQAALATVISLSVNDDPDLQGVNEPASASDKSVGSVVSSLSEKQKNVFYYLVGKATEGVEHDGIKNQFDEGENMKQNVFDGDNTEEGAVLSHEAISGIFADALKNGSLKESFMAHAATYGIDDVGLLAPDGYYDPNGPAPEFISRDTGWVTDFMDGAKHSPMSRIKTRYADITADEARAKGYVTASEKDDQIFTLIKRVTTPTTVYVKQKLDRDDFIDIVDFDVAFWMKGEMRELLTEEVARAAMVGDQRVISDPDKINEERIRPIYSDAEMYAHHIQISAGTSILDVIDTVTASRQYYKGSGSPTLYCTTVFLNEMLLKRDGDGRRLHKTENELAAVLRVARIVEVEVMDNIQRDVNGTDYELLGIIVNPKDYTFGADKGGKTTFFDDFDIKFNQLQYLYETRLSGALTKYKSAIVFEAEMAA